MKIKVDFDLCESNALCEALAPTHFQIDDDDFLQILDEIYRGYPPHDPPART